MERVVAIADQAGEDVDVLIVQGMHPEMGMVHSTRVNALVLKALDAEPVLVAARPPTRRRSSWPRRSPSYRAGLAAPSPRDGPSAAS